MADIFSNMLQPWQWLLLSLIPPAIIALYFLKLRRQPLEVPSTYLWHRTLEDLHVNSLWQRLRQNILMYLQLLLIGLLMLACLRPSWNKNQLMQDRFIFMIDVSASMSATDVQPTRLDFARQQIDNLIQQMKPGDAAMIISFSDESQYKVEQPFTTLQRKLRSSIARVQPTQRGSDVGEALSAAAGLANPGRTSETGTSDVQVADAMPADVYIFSDGAFRSVPQFSWGNLRPIFVPMGLESSTNMAITNFSAGKPTATSNRMQAIAEIENFGDQPVAFNAELHLNDILLDAAEYTVDANESEGIEFNLDAVSAGVLRLTIDADDDLSADNQAYIAINPPSQAKVLLVTEGNDALETVLRTEQANQTATITTMSPQSLAGDDYRDPAAAGLFDLVIFDQCRPEELPAANTLFIDALPPGDDWQADEPKPAPQIIDTDLVHPLMTYVGFGDVRFAEARSVSGPPGQKILMEMDIGPVGVLAPREGFEDFVLGFGLLSNSADGGRLANTDWPLRLSFPVFFHNLVAYLGGSDQSSATNLAFRPGEVVTLRTVVPQETIEVKAPSGKASQVARNRENSHVFFGTDEIGIYEVDDREADTKRRFAVNLFDQVESNIRPREALQTAWTEVEATQAFETTKFEAWRWILLVALGILLFEWYVFNRRVYL